MLPSEFAERYRYLKEGTTERPGKWSNSVYPYLVAIMNVVLEAIRNGKTGVVLMKSGQGGGSEGMLNVVAWLLDQFPGPLLYLISTDMIAKSFEKDRIKHLVRTCEPLRRKAFLGKSAGETQHEKRFTDGKLTIFGGKSVSKIESVPYRFVLIDEIDSLNSEMGRQGISGDIVEVAKIRLNSFTSEHLLIAFAHPTNKDRGAGQLYYRDSDQRRAHIDCPHCDEQFWLRWDIVKVCPEEGESEEVAARKPSRYRMFAPCCGAEVSDQDRYRALRDFPQQISVLDPETAESKSWIGVHFSQLYDSIPLARLAEEWVGVRGNTARERVFVNKRMGDVFDAKIKEADPDAWRALITVPQTPGDPKAWSLGTVPPGVRFLTAGQDSRSTELHWAVWGWGHVKGSDGEHRLCGWLVDCGVVERAKSLTLEAADLGALDQFLYRREFWSSDKKGAFKVRQCLHDSGWQPIAAYEYCRRRRGRAYPCRGDAVDDRSSAPAIRWGAVPPYVIGSRQIKDPAARLALLNTYLLKTELFGMVDRRFPTGKLSQETVLRLPINVPDRFISECSAEFLAEIKGKQVWKRKGANHFLDCTVYALASAINLGGLATSPKEDSRASGGMGQGYAAAGDKSNENARSPYDARDGDRDDGWTIGRY